MPKPPNVLYRGIDFKESELNKVGKAKVFKYGLKKPANSWSVKKDAAIEFGNAILIIKGGKLAQYGTVFLWPTINTEWQYILHLRTHLFEYEWAVRLEKEMPIDKIEILYGRI
jgi:hypothetical protein